MPHFLQAAGLWSCCMELTFLSASQPRAGMKLSRRSVSRSSCRVLGLPDFGSFFAAARLHDEVEVPVRAKSSRAFKLPTSQQKAWKFGCQWLTWFYKSWRPTRWILPGPRSPWSAGCSRSVNPVLPQSWTQTHPMLRSGTSMDFLRQILIGLSQSCRP